MVPYGARFVVVRPRAQEVWDCLWVLYVGRYRPPNDGQNVKVQMLYVVDADKGLRARSKSVKQINMCVYLI